jgi:putative Holliday junction resolvase
LSRKRILALDVGNKRIGVAYSDPSGISITPLETIQNNEKVFEKIKNLVNEFNVGEIVIGLPLTLRGEEGEQARITREFGERLKKEIPEVEIKFIDERFTTALAEKHLAQTTKKTKRKKKLDSLSATYILQTYLMQKQIGNV